MAVTRISAEELNAERNAQPVKTAKTNNASHDFSSDTKYVDRISDKQIANFFEPYGYIAHERIGEIILVYCNDLNVIFDDFKTIAEQKEPLYRESQLFNFREFEEQCMIMQTNPSATIGDRLAEELFGNLPYYAEKRKEYFDDAIGSVSKNKKYANILSPTIDRQKYRNRYAQTLKYYGSTDPEKITDTIVRANTK